MCYISGKSIFCMYFCDTNGTPPLFKFNSPLRQNQSKALHMLFYLPKYLVGKKTPGFYLAIVQLSRKAIKSRVFFSILRVLVIARFFCCNKERLTLLCLHGLVSFLYECVRLFVAMSCTVFFLHLLISIQQTY